jgi:hypothetical protein
VYEIPAPWNALPVYCYAVKSHPEFEQTDNEIVFTFMSNAGLRDLVKMTDVYIPQVIRVTILEI